MYMHMYTCKRMSCIKVCHVYIYTCVHLVRVDLDIILLVVSDGDDSAKGWKSLFENVGVFEVHELHEFFVHSAEALSSSVRCRWQRCEIGTGTGYKSGSKICSSTGCKS